MAETTESSGAPRDRSPAYPIVPLGNALERLAQFDTHFKRSPARPGAVAAAWNITGKAYGDRMAAALRYFGLLEYEGTGKDRQVVVSDQGRKYLRAQQEETKREVIRTAALRPRNIAKYWNLWGSARPAEAACLDQLVLRDGFSEQGARDFLKVYDQTIAYAGLSSSDKVPVADDSGDQNGGDAYALEGTPEEPARKGVSFVKKARASAQPGMLEEVFTLEEGPVTLTFPAELSRESYQDLADHLELLLRKAKRRSEKLFGERANPSNETAD